MAYCKSWRVDTVDRMQRGLNEDKKFLLEMIKDRPGKRNQEIACRIVATSGLSAGPKPT